jgi:hypothetical protein
MSTKKLKNFEFANHTEKGKIHLTNTDEVLFFDCPNGSVFLICQDRGENTTENSLSALAVQRIRYYLENEYVVNPVNAIYNALIYTNGFIFEYARKKRNSTRVHSCSVLVFLSETTRCIIQHWGIWQSIFSMGRKTF